MLEPAPASDQASARLLPSAYHSRGLIFAAAGRDDHALTWFRKADAARQAELKKNVEQLQGLASAASGAKKIASQPSAISPASSRFFGPTAAR